MKILVVIGSALGTINHALALSHLLKENGHDIVWITGPEARPHLNQMCSPYKTHYSKAHSLKFRANNPGKVPHFVHVCRYEYLKKSIEYEIKVIKKIKPDLVITKHHYSPTISSQIFGIPFAYYCTDGVEYKFEKRNPHNRWENKEGMQDYQKLCREFGIVYEEKQYVTEYLFSPHLNIIRGVPLTFSLTEKEMHQLEKDQCIFSGLLTFDGPPSASFEKELQRIREDDQLIYITFGTHYYEKERIKILLEALVDFKGYIIVSTGYFDPKEFYSDSKKVIFLKYVPNKQAIARANLVIHHAGSGTTMSCFSAGVPQIVVPNNPKYSGQVYFSDTIEGSGCGKRVDFKDLSVYSIKQEIEHILSNDTCKKNANELKEKLFQQNLECNQDICQVILHLSEKKKLSLYEKPNVATQSIRHPSPELLKTSRIEDFCISFDHKDEEDLKKHILAFKKEYGTLQDAAHNHSGESLKKFILSDQKRFLHVLSKRIRTSLFDQSGVSILKNFPLFDLQDQEIAVFAFICYLGLPVYNNRDKTYVWSVIPQQLQSSKLLEAENYRIGNTGNAVGFHTDTSTIVGLQYLIATQDGGENEIISSIAVHNKILETRPDLLHVLYSNFFIDRRGEEMNGEKPFSEIPIFQQTSSGELLSHWTRLYTYEAYRKYDIPPLTDTQKEAIEYLILTVRSIASQSKIVFKGAPGDFLFLNNNIVFHNRLAFSGDRHLLRV